MIENIYKVFDDPYVKDKKRLELYYKLMLDSKLDFNNVTRIGIIGIDYYSNLKYKIKKESIESFIRSDLEFPQIYDDNCDYVFFEKIEMKDLKQYLLIHVVYEDYTLGTDIRALKELTEEEIRLLPDYKILRYEKNKEN